MHDITTNRSTCCKQLSIPAFDCREREINGNTGKIFLNSKATSTERYCELLALFLVAIFVATVKAYGCYLRNPLGLFTLKDEYRHTLLVLFSFLFLQDVYALGEFFSS